MIRDHDALVLAPGVTIVDGRLCDAVRATSWPLNATAAFVLGRAGEPLCATIAALADALGISLQQARADVLRFVWQLNLLALVNVERSGSRVRQLHEWIALAARLAPAGAVPGVLTSRRPIDTRSAIRGLVTGGRATLPRAVVVAVVAAALAAQLAAVAGADGVLLAVAAGIGLGAGVAVHEGAHAALLRGVPSALVSRGRRTYVLHASLPPSRRRWVAVAGPAAAATLGVSLVTAGEVATMPALAAAGWPLATHALGLTVATSDGRIVCGT